MIAIEHMILTAANASRCLFREQGRFFPKRPSLGCSFPIKPVVALASRGRLLWADDARRQAIITDAGRQAIGAPPMQEVAEGRTHCELCGKETKLYRALLKKPWTDETATVHACSRCSRIAWKTVELIGKRPQPAMTCEKAGGD